MLASICFCWLSKKLEYSFSCLAHSWPDRSVRIRLRENNVECDKSKYNSKSVSLWEACFMDRGRIDQSLLDLSFRLFESIAFDFDRRDWKDDFLKKVIFLFGYF